MQGSNPYRLTYSWITASVLAPGSGWACLAKDHALHWNRVLVAQVSQQLLDLGPSRVCTEGRVKIVHGCKHAARLQLASIQQTEELAEAVAPQLQSETTE